MRFQNGTWSCGGKSFSTLHEALLSVWPKERPGAGETRPHPKTRLRGYYSTAGNGKAIGGFYHGGFGERESGGRAGRV